MPLVLLVLLGSAIGTGLGFWVARKSCNVYELEAKKAYDICVKTLVEKKKLNPTIAKEVCTYKNLTLDFAKLSLLTASVVASLAGIKVLQNLLNKNKEVENVGTTKTT